MNMFSGLKGEGLRGAPDELSEASLERVARDIARAVADRGERIQLKSTWWRHPDHGRLVSASPVYTSPDATP